MKKKTMILLSILLSWFIVHEIIIIIDGLVDNPQKSDFIIVFGNTVNRDGSLSDRLKSRLNASLKLYNQQLSSTIFVSGGLGKEGYYEGSKMAEYLILKGIPQENIIVDNKGNTSILTARNFEKQFKNVQSVIVVSQFFHISRCKLALNKVGVKTVYGVHCNYYESRDLYSLFREFFAYYKYLIFY